MPELNDLPKYEPESKKEQSSSDSKVMEWLMTYGWIILVVLIVIGSLAYFGVLDFNRDVPETTTSTSTSIATTSTIMETQILSDCPDKFLRKNIDGTTYCPDKKVFGCSGLTWEECESQELDDELFTTTTVRKASRSTTTSIIEETTSTIPEETTTTIEDTLTFSSGSNYSGNKKRMII